MKISIVTFHNTSNFGATLQCVALFNYLKEKGCAVEVVNYLPKYVRDKKSVTKELRRIHGSKNVIKAVVKGLVYLSYFSVIKRRDNCFEKFIDANINLTLPYYDGKQIENNPPRADVFICGSDQIWNPALTGNRFDEVFFLKYASGRKYAYGVSLGELDIELHETELRTLTEGFEKVTVREKSVAKRLSKAIQKDVGVVLDCTLLLDKNNYSKMERKVDIIRDPYVLLYNMQNSTLSTQLAKKLADEYSLSIIDISPNLFSRIDNSHKLIDIGPSEFLNLIRNARFVVTNSFHGTVFSIIYEKNFYSVAHSKRSARVLDLLDTLNLSDRMINNIDDLDSSPIDYVAVNSTLNTIRQRSYNYINGILTEK